MTLIIEFKFKSHFFLFYAPDFGLSTLSFCYDNRCSKLLFKRENSLFITSCKGSSLPYILPTFGSSTGCIISGIEGRCRSYWSSEISMTFLSNILLYYSVSTTSTLSSSLCKLASNRVWSYASVFKSKSIFGKKAN